MLASSFVLRSHWLYRLSAIEFARRLGVLESCVRVEVVTSFLSHTFGALNTGRYLSVQKALNRFALGDRGILVGCTLFFNWFHRLLTPQARNLSFVFDLLNSSE